MSVSGSSVILTLGSAVASGATVTVSYTVPTDAAAPRIQDEAGNPTASFTDQDVENNTPPPANTPATGAPTITGTVRVGETLTAETSAIADADGMSGAVFIYQWLADDADIAGATSDTYTLVDADLEKAVKVRVIFTDNADNEEPLTSEATAAVAPRPNSPATGAPTISETAQVGETLTADTSGIDDADGMSKAVFSYQWLANGADVAGATSDTYTPVADDVGKAIKVKVSFRDDRTHQESLTSAVTAAADDSAVWSATLTVGSIAGYRGFWKDVGMGELTSDVFTLDGVDYTVKVLADSDGPQFYLTLDKALPVGFTLQVGATTLSSQDASIREYSPGATQYGWAEPGSDPGGCGHRGGQPHPGRVTCRRAVGAESYSWPGFGVVCAVSVWHTVEGAPTPPRRRRERRRTPYRPRIPVGSGQRVPAQDHRAPPAVGHRCLLTSV